MTIITALLLVAWIVTALTVIHHHLLRQRARNVLLRLIRFLRRRCKAPGDVVAVK